MCLSGSIRLYAVLVQSVPAPVQPREREERVRRTPVAPTAATGPTIGTAGILDKAQKGRSLVGMFNPGMGLLSFATGQAARVAANRAYPRQSPIGFVEDITQPDIMYGTPFEIQRRRAGRDDIGTSREAGISVAAKANRVRREAREAKGTSREKGISVAAKANRSRREARESSRDKGTSRERGISAAARGNRSRREKRG